MSAGLLVIVPSRSRPESVGLVVQAWEETGAYADGGQLMFVVDADDPAHDDYLAQADSRALMAVIDQWQPMVHKLDRIAAGLAGYHYAVGFAGDDHRPRTLGWVKRYLEELRDLRSGIVYGDDGHQGQRLPTQWAMTSDIVQALGRMVPAPVEHLYCDNSILDLGRAIGRIRYLPDVLVEHMHPVAGKAANDDQYQRVNGRAQYARDHAAYKQWLRRGLRADAARIRDYIAARRTP